MRSQQAGERELDRYDPRRHFDEEYPDWTLAVRPRLPTKALVSVARRTILLDRSSWSADAEGVLAHVLALLDLNLVPPAGGEVAPTDELLASGLAGIRLDRIRLDPDAQGWREDAENH